MSAIWKNELRAMPARRSVTNRRRSHFAWLAWLCQPSLQTLFGHQSQWPAGNQLGKPDSPCQISTCFPPCASMKARTSLRTVT